MSADPLPGLTVRRLDADQRRSVEALIAAVQLADGSRPLSDHLWLDLGAHDSPTYHGVLLPTGDVGDLVGYAQLQPNGGVWSLETVVHPAHRSGPALARLLELSRGVVGATGGGEINWWALQQQLAEDPAVERAAATTGFVLGRLLHQMRRPLPLSTGTDVAVRPFVVGQDEQPWLRVNNAAFSGHPEQGNWTADTLAQRQAEPWFDPSGFLLHERDGRLAAFCWTKVHDEHEPVMGEIYVIAVDPAFHGLGLGKALTVAGLEHIARLGITVGMLYVDGDNVAGLGLYEALGFTTHHTDRAYLAEVPAATHDAGAHPPADSATTTQGAST